MVAVDVFCEAVEDGNGGAVLAVLVVVVVLVVVAVVVAVVLVVVVMKRGVGFLDFSNFWYQDKNVVMEIFFYIL